MKTAMENIPMIWVSLIQLGFSICAYRIPLWRPRTWQISSVRFAQRHCGSCKSGRTFQSLPEFAYDVTGTTSCDQLLIWDDMSWLLWLKWCSKWPSKWPTGGTNHSHDLILGQQRPRSCCSPSDPCAHWQLPLQWRRTLEWELGKDWNPECQSHENQNGWW